MQRAKKQLGILLAILGVFCLGIVIFAKGSASRDPIQTDVPENDVTEAVGENSQSPKNDEIVTGDTAALEEPEQTSVSYVKGMFAGECEEQYGKNIGSDFLIVELDDTEEGIDWDTIRNLKCYVAEPAFTTEEIIYRMADFFWQDAEYTTSRESAVQRTSGQLTGWGDRYTCTEEISKEIIMGTNYGVSFMEGNKAREVGDPEGFVRELCEQLRFGLYKNGESTYDIRQEWLFGRKNYVMKEEIDGIMVNNQIDEGQFPDKDGVRYLGYSPLFYFEGQKLVDMESFYSANVTEARDLKHTWNNREKLQDAVEKGIKEAGSGAGSVYRLDHYYLFYARGITEDHRFVYTPWLICEGVNASFWPSPYNEWKDHVCIVAVNLDAGTVSDYAADTELLRNYR